MANLSMSHVYRLLALDLSHKPLCCVPTENANLSVEIRIEKLQITRSVRIPNRIWEIGPCCGSQNGAVTQQATTARCTNQRVYTRRTSVNGSLQIKTSIRNIQSFSVKPQNSVKKTGGKQFSSPVEGVFRSFLHSPS